MLKHLFTHNRWQKIFSLLLASLIWFAVHSGLGLSVSGTDMGRDTRSWDHLPITVLTPAADLGHYNVNPAQVSVVLRGDGGVLDKIRPQDLEVYVNLVEASESRMTRPIHIYAPADTQVLSISPAEVQIERLPPPIPAVTR
ncbi:MAG TPA: CdaR family protein [Candidatus Limnocylindria bacterium]|jgi:YbbR domain-containing protein|nr:CdaR family protein [Candidatus Limnocylindria bacterium]